MADGRDRDVSGQVAGALETMLEFARRHEADIKRHEDRDLDFERETRQEQSKANEKTDRLVARLHERIDEVDKAVRARIDDEVESLHDDISPLKISNVEMRIKNSLFGLIGGVIGSFFAWWALSLQFAKASGHGP